MYCYNGLTYFRKSNNYYNYSIIPLYLILIQQLQYYIDSTLEHINDIRYYILHGLEKIQIMIFLQSHNTIFIL